MSYIYLDIETDNSEGCGLDPYISKVVTFQVLFPSGKYALIKDPQPNDLVGLKAALESNTVVGDNIKFECKFLKHHFGITLKNVFDTQIAEQAIYGGQLSDSGDSGRKHPFIGKSLKDIAFRYCGVTLDKEYQCTFKIGVDLIPEQIEYALSDVKYLPEIMKQQQVKIRNLGLERVIDIEMKCIPAVAWLELSGIHVDRNKFEEIKEKVQKQYEETERFLQEELVTYGQQKQLDGEFVRSELNLSSHEQLKQALQRKGYAIESTSKKARAKFKNEPVFEKLNEFKEAETIIKMAIKPFPSFINQETQRVFGDFWQYGAASGRFTGKKPNLQQQSNKFDWRTIFTAEPGNKLVVADYSQIELRIIGQLAKDPKYIEAYRTKQDLHKRTAAVLFNIPEDQVTKQQRNVAKTVNFALNYGMGKKSLKDRLKLVTVQDFTEEAAAEFINTFRNLYPDVNSYLRKASRAGLAKLEARTLTGRLFKFYPPCGQTEEERKAEEGSIMRESKNLPVQGLCADMLKIAMANLFTVLEPRSIKLVNCIHDELVFECKAEEAEEIRQIVKLEMESAGNLFLTVLPCEVEVNIADYWKKE
jgi:DNA polymerase-1